MNVYNTYEELVILYSNQLLQLNKKRTKFGWIRLVILVAVLILAYRLFFDQSLIMWTALAVGIAGFVFAIVKDADNNEKIADVERLLSVNEEELKILDGNFYHREDGSVYLPIDHAYAADIDLFGKASIYQYINRCTSEQSKALLASLLLNPSDSQVIPARQQAAKELASDLAWRQKLQVSGIADPLTLETEKKIRAWLAMPPVMRSTVWKILPHIYTVITLATLAAYLYDLIPGGLFTLLLFLYFVFASFLSGKVTGAHKALSKIEAEVNTIEEQLKLVEHIPVSSGILNSYKEKLLASKVGSPATRELKKILHRFDYRMNVYAFVLINTFLLWDVRQMNSLNKWKDEHSATVPDWFDILANVEVLNTLAILTFNHPTWVFPKIDEDHFTLNAEKIGHPLIDTAKRVNNSFSINGVGKVSIITGSNMAGKSTFLRSVGVNLVLAQMGAPVCAASFTWSPVHLFSSMRIADNLAENTSTFYAELKKLKVIIEQVKAHRKVFILLDEILRGTNSVDRHTGSEALIKQLIKEHAVAVIATHDVELAALELQFPKAIENYHFDVQVEGEELYFDYKLKEGVCTSMNASLLMKKIGIEV